MINRRLIPFLAGLLALPSLAGAAEPAELYGKLGLSFDRLDDGTGYTRNLSSNGSHVGVRGAHSLGAASSAVFQIETGVETDAATDPLRDTYLGLQGGFGLLRLGRFDTPMKRLGRNADLFADQIGDVRNISRNTGAGVHKGFDERLDNSIHYRTPPLWGSWSIDYHYSTDASGAAADQQDNQNDAWSSALTYRFGGMYLAYAKEVYNQPGGRNARRFAGAYEYGPWRFTTLYQWADNPDDRVRGFGFRYRPARLAFKTQYYRLLGDDPRESATMIAAGWDYAFSEQFNLYLLYAKMDNESNSRLSPFHAGRTANTFADSLGDETKAISVGGSYRF